MSTAPANVSEYDAIAKVIKRYLDGARAGKGADMKPSFHEDATIFGYVGGDFFAGPIEKLFAWTDDNGAATGIHPRISSIDLVGTAATVRIEIESWYGHRFTDLFTLLKLDGGWKIMNKVFHLHTSEAKSA